MLTDRQLNWVDEEVMRIVPVYENEDKFCSTRKRTVTDLRNLIRENLINKLMNPEKSTTKEIAGTSIDTSHPDISTARNVDDLVRLDIFAGLPKEQQHEAYKELFDHLHPEHDEEEFDQET